MTSAPRLLIVEDDDAIAELTALHLRAAGHAVTRVADGAAALRAFDHEPWDAIVLDLMLPLIDGTAVCRHVRAQSHYTPIVMTSARATELDRIVGLELGADDYLAKPFSVPELVARVRALLRRGAAIERSARLAAGGLELGGLRLDPLARSVAIDGRGIELTRREFDLLHLLARHPGTVYSRLDLLAQVWGYRHAGYEHTVNTHINRLRAKVEDDPAKPRRVLTVWGRGYTCAG